MQRSEQRGVNRRQFLVQGAVATAALAASSRLAQAAAEGPIVAIIRDKSKTVIQGQTVNATIVQNLVDKAVMTLSGKDDIAKAWATYVSPKDKVAVKFNGLFANATTHPEVITAVTNGLLKAGVNPANIVVYDRADRDFETARVQINRDGDGPRAYPTGQNLGDPVKAGPVETRLSRILLDADVLINVPMMKTHVLAGITGALKNHMGSIPNAGAFHPDPEEKKRNNVILTADVNALEPIRTKTRICICDALYALFDGGPQFRPNARWDYCGVIASVDPVAMDVTLAELIKAKRLEEGKTPYHAPIAHVERAIKLGLGVGDLAKIKRVEIEV